MSPLEDGAAETLRSAVMRLGFFALDRPDMQHAAKEASAHSAPMCSLLYPCLHFDVAVEPAAMANEESWKETRTRLGARWQDGRPLDSLHSFVTSG